MFGKILIANRGEIACRIIKTARRLGIKTVAVYSDADEQALHVEQADEAIRLGPPPASESYLLTAKIIDTALKAGAEAIHPGYGFLSENTGFAGAVEAAGITFIGPNVKAIEVMGDKIISKKYARDAQVSIIPGHPDVCGTQDEAMQAALEIGFPVMIKAAAGGGGKGMRIARSEQDLIEGFGAAGREAEASFGDGRVFIEKYIDSPRHIEIQVLCDKHGQGVHLGERECSLQRRNQKVVEETPSLFVDEALREKMGAESLVLAQMVGYDSAGTVEFVVAPDRSFYFLEMNTRLQVEHPVTEMVSGLDLVEEMIRIAAGEKLRYSQQDIQARRRGWAMEARLYAENPQKGFMPSTGRLSWFRPPEGDFRLDTGVREGDAISMFYDPMIAKLITYAATRGEAAQKMSVVLDGFQLSGIDHNLLFLNAIFNHKDFLAGDMDTGFIAKTWPDGFKGAELDDKSRKICLAAALDIYLKEYQRAGQLTGGHLPRPQRDELAVCLDDGHQSIILTPEFFYQGDNLHIDESGRTYFIKNSTWRFGDKIWTGEVDGARATLQIERIASGLRLCHQGASVRVYVRPRAAQKIAARLPQREDKALATELLCPMPGQVIALHVKAGDFVSVGQALATVEAMKMENILRAENDVVVKQIVCQPGQSLSCDDLVMTFELPEIPVQKKI